MRPRSEVTGVEIALDWGDFPLCRRVLRPGDALTVPGTAHVIRVERSGLALLARDGMPVEALALSSRSTLGALTLSVSPALAPSFAAAGWCRDCFVALSMFAYFAAVVVAALCEPPSYLASGRMAGEARFSNVELKVHARAPRLGVEVAPDWRPAARPATPPAREGDQHMIFPEAPAPERGVRSAGQRVPRARADQRPGGTGARAKLAEGRIGNPHAPALAGTWAIAHRYDEREPRLANEQRTSRLELSEAPIGFGPRTYSRYSGQDHARDEGCEIVTAPFGGADTNGFDDRDTVGNMFGPEPTDPVGKGLAAAREGPGGGGRARRIGLGQLGAQGHGAGTAWGQGSGVPDASRFARDASLGTHATRAPSFATRVAPEVTERVLGRVSDRLRQCVRGHADLAFVITPRGTVADVAVTGAGASAAACLRRVVATLHFGAATRAVRVSRHLARR